jgi:hypothetical protein
MKDSNNIVNLNACRSVKELVITAQDTIGKLENALYEILDARSIEAAKELAAEALDEDLETYLEEDDLDLEELDFEDEEKIYTYGDDDE